MTTTLIAILAVCLILLSATAALLTIRAMRKQSEAEDFANALSEKEKQLNKRYNELDRWESELKDQRRRQDEWDDKRKKIYANFEVLDSDENKPDRKAIGKSLSSKIGYALRKEFPDIKERHDNAKGGRTVYSIDFYVTPFE